MQNILLPCKLILLAILIEAGVHHGALPFPNQIADRNAVARGGAAAWRAIHSVRMAGKLEIDGSETVQPFVVELKCPGRVRIELERLGQTAVQVYDGKSWKIRGFPGRTQDSPLGGEWIRAALQSNLGGPLLNRVDKGAKLEFKSLDTVQGHGAYHLRLTLQNGDVQHVWIDTQTFLELKIEGSSDGADGKMQRVSTYLADYRFVQGVMIPYRIETTVEGVRPTERITIEGVALNPELDDSLFSNPELKRPERIPGSGDGGRACGNCFTRSQGWGDPIFVLG